MPHAFRTIAWYAGVALALAAASAQAASPKTKVAEERVPIQADASASAPVVFLKKTVVKSTNEKIGTLRTGMFCGNSQDATFTPMMGSLVMRDVFKVFRKELDAAGYPKPQKSEAIFETNTAAAVPDYEIGMALRDLQLEGCQSGGSFDGGIWVQLHWELFSPRQQKVVYTLNTEGSAQTPSGEHISSSDLAQRAMTAAVRNLLADAGFAQQVRQMPAGDAVAAADAALKPGNARLAVAHAARQGQKLADRVPQLRSAVVTIFNGSGSGSGFYIDSQGYLLTNHHVVGDAQFLKVKLASGRELVGEVLRSDRLRDVALIKTEPVALAPIEVAASEPGTGSDVYALGSPLGERFASSVTRGVLSGTRTEEKLRWLQSDVKVLPGSSGGPLLGDDGAAVGITTRGIGGGMAGINMFIPIKNALDILKIDIGDAAKE